jgi:hypothetical protein
MSRTDTARKTVRSKQGEKSPDRDADRAHPVGYGSPPVASRFKTGASGNPKGRPRGSKNLKTLIRQAMTAKISIQEGPSSRRVSKIEGVVLRQLQSALKGNDRSAMAVIKMATQMGFLEDPDGKPAEATALSASDERILEELLTRRHGTRRR